MLEAAKMKSFLTNDIRSGEGVDPFAQICVMGLLSVTKTMRFPFHCFPQVNAAATMANNSLKSMSMSIQDGGHAAWIHDLP